MGRRIGTGRSTPPIPAAKQPTRRLRPDEREKQIIKGAVQFFAEVGFSGETRELARRLGITQPLLYRYFPTKDALIERVYQEVFLSRWSPFWEAMIEDQGTPLKQRLIDFYKDYAHTILDREWFRIFMFAGLKGSNINQRFLAMVSDRTLTPICRELRREFGLPSPAEMPVTEDERELVWAINGRIMYLGVRRWIYQTRTPKDLDRVIEQTINVFFGGVRPVLQDLLSAPHHAGRTV